MNKILPNAIILRFTLRNNFLKHRTEEKRNSCSKQRNLCVTLQRKSKSEYFGDLDEKNLRECNETSNIK